MYDYECYQKEQLIKELLLLENHYVTNKCPHCIRKHTLTVIALAEETIKMTPHDREKQLFRELINLPGNVEEIRKLRLRLTDTTPVKCDIMVKKEDLDIEEARKAIRKWKIPMKTHSAQELMEMSGIMR